MRNDETFADKGETNLNECKHSVCRCGHFQQEHRGFYWFNPTGCKIKNCNCEKFTSIGEFTFDEAPKSAQENVLID